MKKCGKSSESLAKCGKSWEIVQKGPKGCKSAPKWMRVCVKRFPSTQPAAVKNDVWVDSNENSITYACYAYCADCAYPFFMKTR